MKKYLEKSGKTEDEALAAALRAELRELGLPAEIVGELTERRETEILVTND